MNMIYINNISYVNYCVVVVVVVGDDGCDRYRTHNTKD